VAHPTGKPTERRLRVLQPERATAPVPDPTEVSVWYADCGVDLQECRPARVAHVLLGDGVVPGQDLRC
jgi:hypothetical protein